MQYFFFFNEHRLDYDQSIFPLTDSVTNKDLETEKQLYLCDVYIKVFVYHLIIDEKKKYDSQSEHGPQVLY